MAGAGVEDCDKSPVPVSAQAQAVRNIVQISFYFSNASKLIT